MGSTSSTSRSSADEALSQSAMRLESLPQEIIVEILQYLDVRSLCRMSRVNKAMWAYVADPYVWRELDLRGLAIENLRSLVAVRLQEACVRSVHLDALQFELIRLNQGDVKHPSRFSRLGREFGLYHEQGDDHVSDPSDGKTWSGVKVLYVAFPRLSTAAASRQFLLTKWTAWSSLTSLVITTSRLTTSASVNAGSWEPLLVRCGELVPSLCTAEIVWSEFIQDGVRIGVPLGESAAKIRHDRQTQDQPQKAYGSMKMSYDCTTKQLNTTYAWRTVSMERLDELYGQLNDSLLSERFTGEMMAAR